MLPSRMQIAAVGLLENGCARPDDRGNVERTRNDRGVRSRAAQSGAKSENAFRIKPRAIRRREIVRHEDDGIVRQMHSLAWVPVSRRKTRWPTSCRSAARPARRCVCTRSTSATRSSITFCHDHAALWPASINRGLR